MHIQNISITSMRRSMDGTRVLGDVIFQINTNDDDRTLRVSCDTPFSKSIRPDAILIGDAIRQLRRQPDIRSGDNRLTFEPGLRPLSSNPHAVDRLPATG